MPWVVGINATHLRSLIAVPVLRSGGHPESNTLQDRGCVFVEVPNIGNET